MVNSVPTALTVDNVTTTYPIVMSRLNFFLEEIKLPIT